MIMLPKINLVIVGHVDHGKSTLIGRLLYDSGAVTDYKIHEVEMEAGGMDFAHFLDSLEEEREGGLTIDTIQTPFKSEKYNYMVIDCPGHKEFLRNMLTGASQADAGILVCSASEGIQEQTKRHVYLLNMLGVKNLLVAVNKMDLVSYQESVFNDVRSKMREFLTGLGFEDENITYVPISAKNGDNVYRKSDKMDWYSGSSIIKELDRGLKPSVNLSTLPLRMPVQDVYDIDGKKIAVGYIETGIIRNGDNVFFNDDRGNVVDILSWNKDGINSIESSMAGESIGLILTSDVSRGDVISDKKKAITDSITGEVIVLERNKINKGDVLKIRCGTSDVKCFIDIIDQRINSETGEVIEENAGFLSENESGMVKIKLEKSIFVDVFSDLAHLGRFILLKNDRTIAAGVITKTSF